jgi:hypothetical protein
MNNKSRQIKTDLTTLTDMCKIYSRHSGECKIAMERQGQYLCRAIDALKGFKTCEYQSDKLGLDFDIHGKEMYGYWVCLKEVKA